MARSRSERFSSWRAFLTFSSRALAQGDRAGDGLDLLDVGEHLLLVHLGPRHRVEAEDHDVDLAALQEGPLLGPLLRGVGVGGDEALAGAAADLLALRADHDDAVVGQRAQDVVVPLPHERARHEDHGAADPALLARAGDDRQRGVGLADADVEEHAAAALVEHAQHAGDLMQLELRRVACPTGRSRGARA
jgi:hypothetical protein